MEQKTVSGKIPAELHARFRSEMEARGWTMCPSRFRGQ